jgi:hypothetical protein
MIAALALAAGACGGDDDSDVSSDAEATSDSDVSSDAEVTSDTSNDDADSGDDNDSGDTSDSGDLGDLSGTDEQEIARSFFELMGLTEEQASCVIDKIDLDEIETATDDLDLSRYTDVLEDCGVDTGDLADVGEIGDVGDLSSTDQEVVRQQMVRVFTLMGMTEEQANCVVDNIDLDELDNAASADPSEYFDLFDDCGFDLTNPGG